MKDILDIGITDVKNKIEEKGYKTFRNGVPNIIGIRNTQTKSNAYNDRCWVFWEENGIENVHNYTISTHPGFYYLEHPIAGTDGTAILVPDQYIECWVLGMHRGKQFALCQRAGEVSVYRDNNKDNMQDCDPSTIQKGYFGIDIHHGALDDSDVINKFSAGCQVFRYAVPHEDLMRKFQYLSNKFGYSKFSYTLLLQSDFN